jgi:hypothetical protein
VVKTLQNLGEVLTNEALTVKASLAGQKHKQGCPFLALTLQREILRKLTTPCMYTRPLPGWIYVPLTQGSLGW